MLDLVIQFPALDIPCVLSFHSAKVFFMMYIAFAGIPPSSSFAFP